MKKVEIKLQIESEELGQYITTILVEKLDEKLFRMLENDYFIDELTLDVIFEAQVNEKGIHQLLRITKESSFITRRYLLSQKYTKSDYLVLGEEIEKYGGYWQVDFGSLATVNIPPDFVTEYEALIKSLELDFMETKG